MSTPSPDGGNRQRASRTVKLVLMGVAGAALLYSCTPGLGGLGIWPWLWFMGNPFSRGAAVTAPSTTGKPPATAGQSQTQPSQRGGFGSSASDDSSSS